MTELEEKVDLYYPSEDGESGPTPHKAGELRTRRRLVREIEGFITKSLAATESDSGSVNIGDENGALLLISDPKNIDDRGTNPMIIVEQRELVAPGWPVSAIFATTADKNGLPEIELRVHSFRASPNPFSTRRLTLQETAILHKALLGPRTDIDSVRKLGKPNAEDLGRVAAAPARKIIAAHS